MTSTMNERHAALTTIRLAHASLGGTATTIVDYHDDPAAISSPTLITALDALIGDDPDITQTLEYILEIAPDLAIAIALRAELCPLHRDDPEICVDMHLLDAATYERAAANLRRLG